MNRVYFTTILIALFLNKAEAREIKDSVTTTSRSEAKLLSTTSPSYTTTQNYVVNKFYLEPNATTASPRVITNIIYLDGFGRKSQEIQIGGSPGGAEDIIRHHVYGVQGRVEKEYLPYNKANNNGAFDSNAANTSNWNIYGLTEASHAFTLLDYDNSPLDRVVKQTAPGKNWHVNQKGVTTTFGINKANEVKLYRVSNDGTLTLSENYAAGSLQKVSVRDEDGKWVETYTDNMEQTLLVVNIDEDKRLETYSVYDDCGRLRYVLSPEASALIGSTATRTSEAIQLFGYYYEYDGFNRLILKQLPGCDPVYMVYDKRDRLVMSQDGKQRIENINKWSYSLYDGLNRVIETGEIVLSGGITTHVTLQNAASGSDNYVPTGSRLPLQYTLYDNYKATPYVPILPFQPSTGYASGYHDLVKGLVTSVKTKVLGTSQDKWLTTTTYYDDRFRVIQTVSDNLEGFKSRVDIKYDFVGNVVQQRESHQVNTSKTDVLESINTYDDRGRLLSSSVKLNNGSPATVNYSYDAVGRLVKRKLGNVEETMTYNPRGWLTSKESAPFKMKLRYESPTGGSTTCWNGNISEWEWQHGTSATLMYGFTYDKVNRLTSAIQKQKNGTSWDDLSENYLEKGITYDRNGNIKTLQRTAGGTLVDNLIYSFTGNQLTSLTENVRTSPTGDIYSPGSTALGTYTYDKNGNMTKDSREALNITYNVLNLLSEINTTSGSLKARYCYLADGTKLRVRDNGETNGFDYLGSLTYKKNNTVMQLESASFDGGVIRSGDLNSVQMEVNYFLTDHLGSVRVIVDGGGVVKERNDYYPFGARHTKSDYPQRNGNRYKYNGKEEQVTGDLEYLDYGVRMYDSRLGKWMVIDPRLEKFLNISPYAYCVNNPMKYIDPKGEKINFYYWVRDDYSMKRLSGFMNKTTEGLWETFARTKSGFDFLSLYAKAGQSIGGIKFKEDGPFSDIDLNISDFDWLGYGGSFRFDMENGKDRNMSFEISINAEEVIDNSKGKANYLIAIGHEIFIHMEQQHKKYITFFLKEDKKGLDNFINKSTRGGGDYDHIQYINGNESYRSFTTYIQQLKEMKMSPLNPKLIDNSKKNHDALYEKYRKNSK